MILFGLIAVAALVFGAILVIFSFVNPPYQFGWVENFHIDPLVPYIPAGMQRFIFGLLFALGVPFLLFGVLSNNL
ncbi:MAG: hypothetical protein HOV80_36555 [Polyangiaceae bacterium]|nr:hypothetical protein [Polyangiaceae bacterium]